MKVKLGEAQKRQKVHRISNNVLKLTAAIFFGKRKDNLRPKNKQNKARKPILKQDLKV